MKSVKYTIGTSEVIDKLDAGGTGTGEARRVRSQQTEVGAATIVALAWSPLVRLPLGVPHSDVHWHVVSLYDLLW